ncbi:MAG: glycosyltransferase family 2 protein [Alphaproteobacteria bacterium]|nr:glycosyltransferase family 2 protein [Alphaproteobacteria bacterium]
MPRAEHPFLSLVVPVFNEESSIDVFLATVAPIIARQECEHEILFVDDGSRDKTLPALRAAKTHNPSIAILSLSRNFGKEAAMTAGLDHARGDVVIPIDVDLQDPPELIAEFIARWRAGADIVYGARMSRASDGIVKRTSARYFYKLFNMMSPLQIPFDAGDYRLMDRRVVDEIKKLHERNRFMKGLMTWPGFRTERVEFERPQRAAGRTSWNYWKLWNFALDGITSFSTLPLRLWLYVGGIISLLSFLYAGFIIIHAFITGGDVPGYPSLMVAIMFFGGIQLFSIGLVGEYVGRIFNETKGRPIYIIDKIE